MKALMIEYPEELLETLNETEESFAELAKEALIVKLYELGKVSSSIGAKTLGVSRWAFLDLLDRYQISPFDEDAGASIVEEAGRG